MLLERGIAPPLDIGGSLTGSWGARHAPIGFWYSRRPSGTNSQCRQTPMRSPLAVRPQVTPRDRPS